MITRLRQVSYFIRDKRLNRVMKVMKNVLITLYFAIVFGDDDNFIDRVTKYMVEGLHIRRITLVVNTPNNFSIRSIQTVNGILETMPCLILDTNLLRSNGSQDPNFVNTRNLISRRFEHGATKVLIIDSAGNIFIKPNSDRCQIDQVFIFRRD